MTKKKTTKPREYGWFNQLTRYCTDDGSILQLCDNGTEATVKESMLQLILEFIGLETPVFRNELFLDLFLDSITLKTKNI